MLVLCSDDLDRCEGYNVRRVHHRRTYQNVHSPSLTGLDVAPRHVHKSPWWPRMRNCRGPVQCGLTRPDRVMDDHSSGNELEGFPYQNIGIFFDVHSAVHNGLAKPHKL